LYTNLNLINVELKDLLKFNKRSDRKYVGYLREINLYPLKGFNHKNRYKRIYEII